MRPDLRNALFVFCLLLVATSISSAVYAQTGEDKICAIYITGIGCPNCAITDPVLLTEYTMEHPELVIIEYEIYNSRASNQDIANKYFSEYISIGQTGVPFLIFGKENTALGRFQVIDAAEFIGSAGKNPCPLPDGSSVDFDEIDLTGLPGRFTIWTRNRVLQSGTGVSNDDIKMLITTANISSALAMVDYQNVEPEPVPVSGAEISFENAVKIDDWTLQWHGDSIAAPSKAEIVGGLDRVEKPSWSHWYWIIIIAVIILVLYTFYRVWIFRKSVCFSLTETQKNWIIIGVSVAFIISFFLLAKQVSPEFLEKAGYTLPLPIFTFFVALVDGFNPCNMFVLTFLLGLLVSASHSRKRIYTIGYTFVAVVFLIYFLFMAAWLNIFKYIGFITPLRIGIAIIALVAGAINCKELLFFRKGITLMIQDQHKGPLVRRIEAMKGIIMKASLPVLITSSIGLAAFASLVELPCTAGFPIIYTGIIAGKMAHNGYYLYLMLYNLIYILPLAVIIFIFGYTFRTKQISKRQMQIIKFIGGLIMVLLGIILLVNPSMIGIAIG